MDEPRIFRFKVEFDINNRSVFVIFHAETLTELHNLIHEQYPKNKVISILGG